MTTPGITFRQLNPTVVGGPTCKWFWLARIGDGASVKDGVVYGPSFPAMQWLLGSVDASGWKVAAVGETWLATQSNSRARLKAALIKIWTMRHRWHGSRPEMPESLRKQLNTIKHHFALLGVSDVSELREVSSPRPTKKTPAEPAPSSAPKQMDFFLRNPKA